MTSSFNRRQTVPIVQGNRGVSEVIHLEQNVIDFQRGAGLVHLTSVVDTNPKGRRDHDPARTAAPLVDLDHGEETAEHAQFSVTTGVPVYFCDPRSPWQRSTNENTNGLLRQYFPKTQRPRPVRTTTSTTSPPSSTDDLDNPSAG
jgi:hypothetical protein